MSETDRDAVERLTDDELLAQINAFDPYDVEFVRRYRALLAAKEGAEARARSANERATEMSDRYVAEYHAKLAAEAACDRVSQNRDLLAQDLAEAKAEAAALREAAANLKAHAPHLVDGPEHDVGIHYGYHMALDRILAMIEKDKTDDG